MPCAKYILLISTKWVCGRSNSVVILAKISVSHMALRDQSLFMARGARRKKWGGYEKFLMDRERVRKKKLRSPFGMVATITLSSQIKYASYGFISV